MQSSCAMQVSRRARCSAFERPGRLRIPAPPEHGPRFRPAVALDTRRDSSVSRGTRSRRAASQRPAHAAQSGNGSGGPAHGPQLVSHGRPNCSHWPVLGSRSCSPPTPPGSAQISGASRGRCSRQSATGEQGDDANAHGIRSSKACATASARLRDGLHQFSAGQLVPQRSPSLDPLRMHPWLAFVSFWKILFGKKVPAALAEAAPAPVPALPEPAKPSRRSRTSRRPARRRSIAKGRSRCSRLLQREGRFVDFVREEVDGALGRATSAPPRATIHRGCKKALDEHMTLEPVMPGDEGAAVTLPKGLRSRRGAAHRRGQGRARPIAARLRHHGWRVDQMRSCRRSRDGVDRDGDRAGGGRARVTRDVVGIDLGTTNSALASRQRATTRRRASFASPQLVGAGRGRRRARRCRRSCYLPSESEVRRRSCAAVAGPRAAIAVGELARDRGVELPPRLVVVSAKSWLCNAGDRSPARSCRSAARSATRGDAERRARVAGRSLGALPRAPARGVGRRASRGRARSTSKTCSLTVPASFDAVARELTVDAAREAGHREVTLLEEPQAALYAWLAAQRRGVAQASSQPATSCWSCDVGGGTTDFSLIARRRRRRHARARARRGRRSHPARRRQHGSRARRTSCGARSTPTATSSIDWQQRALVHACRPRRRRCSATARQRGAGRDRSAAARKLIGGDARSRAHARRGRAHARRRLLPRRRRRRAAERAPRGGLRELGLPYAPIRRSRATSRSSSRGAPARADRGPVQRRRDEGGRAARSASSSRSTRGPGAEALQRARGRRSRSRGRARRRALRHSCGAARACASAAAPRARTTSASRARCRRSRASRRR